MSFFMFFFSNFSSGGHFVQGSRTVLAILVGVIQGKKGKSVHWCRRRCHFKVLLFLALTAILYIGAERF